MISSLDMAKVSVALFKVVEELKGVNVWIPIQIPFRKSYIMASNSSQQNLKLTTIRSVIMDGLT